MGDSDLVLGIDIGTTGIKALLAGGDGRVAGIGAVATPFTARAGRVEMPLASLRSAIAAAVGALGERRRQVVAVGLASMGEAGVPLDRHGRVAGPLIAWHDPRGAEVVRRLAAAFADALPARVGQATRVQSSLAKIGWFVEQGGEVARWLGAAELALWTLTGAQATEPSLACRTGAYDIRAARFIPEVIAAVGAPPDVFPPVRPAGAVAGLVSPAGAAWLGVPVGVPVTVAGHDHMVGAVGVGIGESDLLDSIGTAEALVRYAGDGLDLAAAVACGADVSIDPLRGRLAVMAGDLRPGRIVEAVRRRVGDAAFAALNRRACPEGDRDEAEELRAGEAVLARLQAEGATPAVSERAAAHWRGLVAAMAAYMARCAGTLEPLTGPPARVVLIGGGARSELWAAAKRRLAGRPVVRSPVEATAYGAALFAGRAAGLWADLAAAPRPAFETIAGEGEAGGYGLGRKRRSTLQM